MTFAEPSKNLAARDAGSFVCILPPKSLELQDNQMRRAYHDLELHQLLHQVDFQGRTRDFYFLPGGGLAADCNVSTTLQGDLMCAFSGHLENYAYLCKKYCLPETALPSSDDDSDAKAYALRALDHDLTLNHINNTRPLSEAEVLCALYMRLGTTLLTKLRGEFAFCIFDAKTVRVLAARDTHGSIELAQARAGDGSLVIASGQFLPEGCHSLTEILPGHFKYGWLSKPQQYAHTEEEIRTGADAAAAAAQRALMGATMQRHLQMQSPAVTDAASESGSEAGSVKSRTRRGKRAGRHQRQRQSLDESRRSMDLKPSMEPAPSALRGPEDAIVARPTRLSLDSMAPPTRSIADRKDWWRQPNSSNSGSGGRRHSVDGASFQRFGSSVLSPLAPVFEPPSPASGQMLAPAAAAFSVPSGVGSAAADGMPTAGRSSGSSDEQASTGSDTEARTAVAAVVESIVEGMGVSRNRSSAALNAMDTDTSSSQPSEALPASALEGGGRTLAQQNSVAAAALLGIRTAPKSLDSMAALQDLPEGLVDKIAGPYREEAASVRMLANLLFHSPCALCITDATQPDMPIVYVNRVFEKATGYPAAEVVGQNCRFLQSPPDKQRVPSAASSAIRRALDSGRANGVRLLNYCKDGTPIYNDLSICPLRNARGHITHHVGMQTFSPTKDAEAHPIGAAMELRKDRGVQKAGGLTGLLAKSRSCLELTSVVDDE